MPQDRAPGYGAVGPDVWLDGLAARLASPEAPSIADAIRRQFGEDLSEAQAERLLELEALLTVKNEPAPPPEAEGSAGGEREPEPAEDGTDRG